MTGQASINGTNIGSYGALLVKGAYEALLTPAPIKAVVQNDSRLQHGRRVIVEQDGSSIKFDSREVTIPILFEGNTRGAYLSGLNSFTTAVTSGLIEFACPSLGITFKLLYQRCQKSKDYGLTYGVYNFTFLEPNPNDR